MSALLKLLPCWGLLERMGHARTHAWFEVIEGLTVLATVPAVEAGEDGPWDLGALEEERHVLQLGGPAFYGFKVLDERSVRQARTDQRPRRFKEAPPAPQLPGPVARPSFPPSGWVFQEEDGVWACERLGAELQLRYDHSDEDAPEGPWLRLVSPPFASAELAARLAEPLICALDLVLNRWLEDGIAHPDEGGVWQPGLAPSHAVPEDEDEDFPY